jgi:hypothetical protein
MGSILLTVFLVLAGILATLFIGVHLYAYAWIWIDGLKLRKQLQKAQRTLTLSEAKEKIRKNEGMILVDAPTLGWNVSRIWWSPHADLLPSDPNDNSEEICSKADIENYSRFIDPVTGTASLVDSFVFTQRAKIYLKKHFGLGEDCPFIFTGGVLFQQRLKKKTNPN